MRPPSRLVYWGVLLFRPVMIYFLAQYWLIRREVTVLVGNSVLEVLMPEYRLKSHSHRLYGKTGEVRPF